jgi:pimeloyl-ACP methyl ester carboxylesterase
VFVEGPEENPGVRWFHESALRDGPGAHNLMAFARVCESLCVDVARRDYSRFFPQMRVPTLAIWGDHDKLTHVGSVLRRLGDIPRLRTVLLKRTGHMPMIERPEETLFHLERFLASPP